ncbi:hypothetical protein Pla123a_16670 [Posidoniimonas polymericola]|uniref:Uncharacterized protein n=1 Tax=Posidoniimonas polymericola TaxID=2528002 RepID=A0A5C5YSE3_9BACT|nr:hypothetical protein [Posidoniimonas polymericola]TWT77869.1 hypothetical protein Pla123a_16670 [Posidoniimonas polymericola]
MINRPQRTRLSQDLRRLVTGRMTNDDFDDHYYDEYESSEDSAVRAVAEFGWGLYSSDVLWPYRLKGRHRVSEEYRRVACRCVLFLRSNREYEWPPSPSEPARRLLWAVCFNLGLPGSIAMLAICVPLLLFGRDKAFAATFVIPSAIVLAGSLWVLFGLRGESPVVRDWKAAGDWEAWPFLRRDDLAAARQGGVTPTQGRA